MGVDGLVRSWRERFLDDVTGRGRGQSAWEIDVWDDGLTNACVRL